MSGFLSVAVLFVFGYGLIRKRPVFSDFCEGVAEGLQVCLHLFPTLLLMLLSIGVFRASGAFDFLIWMAEPFCSLLGIPSQILPLAFVRPLSGGGAISVCESLLRTYGADSYLGRAASVLCASTETTFYTLGVYLPDGKRQGSGKFLFCALFCDALTVFFALLICRII